MPGVPEQPKQPKPEENKSETDPSMKKEDIKAKMAMTRKRDQ
jgi:hypothetical protein